MSQRIIISPLNETWNVFRALGHMRSGFVKVVEKLDLDRITGTSFVLPWSTVTNVVYVAPHEQCECPTVRLASSTDVVWTRSGTDPKVHTWVVDPATPVLDLIDTTRSVAVDGQHPTRGTLILVGTVQASDHSFSVERTMLKKSLRLRPGRFVADPSPYTPPTCVIGGNVHC